MRSSLVKRMGMGLLIVGVLGFLFVQLAPVFTALEWMKPSTSSPSNQEAIEYEPPFTHEATGSFTGSDGKVRGEFRVEIAQSTEEVQYGMMYRKQMAPDMAMLFLMGEEKPQSFWMHNTYVALDIVFIDGKNTVVNVQKNCTPLTDTPRPSEGPALFVVELQGGTADRIGIVPGDHWAYTAL